MKKIVVLQSSGLGNQMFIYGLGYALAREYNMELYQDMAKYYFRITSSRYQLDDYNITYTKKLKIPFKHVPKNKRDWTIKRALLALRKKIFFDFVKEKQFIKYQEIKINPKRSTYLRGFWQNASYVAKYREDLKKEFTPKVIRPEVQKKAEEIKSKNICGIHVRRGDYLRFFGGSMDFSYYIKAMGIITEKNPEVTFLFFSDDIQYCRDVFGRFKNVSFIEAGFSGQEEMYLMRFCKEMIIANSTFSWWGAFLSNAERVICPLTEMWTEEYYMDEWEKIEAKMIAVSSEGLKHIT